ncbi:hypothetical protein IVB14_02320 [Bradyrhizobium sp. 180]|uniref:hypothetical protein n=1 Tax=unclassified Bradyrhizobium TaxID=2631580 RepID=UPI001FF7E467|nr:MULTISPECIES: hypothetical protein [unclassified Bradyrhizobium]MCK1421025.1 hypothetical protein [Bradyrhizobium sp. CW12]MCK1489289.1 hypothetical protein [Bradyrhizobium sp. 180]MCK1526573.1 hypothetical protein [Bradyrhizobium sp. 182]MCK1599503.1 hypothetical protein [Bradyrhizobium sp. 164]MCK1615236.1 hypothetical protein [Bradyrhizobium sp. 159]
MADRKRRKAGGNAGFFVWVVKRSTAGSPDVVLVACPFERRVDYRGRCATSIAAINRFAATSLPKVLTRDRTFVRLADLEDHIPSARKDFQSDTVERNVAGPLIFHSAFFERQYSHA